MSNSLQLHGLYPTRLLCPWGFPGKNTAIFHSKTTRKPSTKRRIENVPKTSLVCSGHFPRSNILPPDQPKGFVTKSIHLLIISQHTYKMNICTKFSKWASLVLIEYIFPEKILNVFPPPTQTPGFKLHGTWASCLHPVCLQHWNPRVGELNC